MGGKETLQGTDRWHDLCGLRCGHHTLLRWYWDFTLENTDHLKRLEPTGFGRWPQIWLSMDAGTKLFIVSCFMMCSSIAETRNTALLPTL